MEGDYSLHSGCWLFVRLCIWSPYSPAYHLVLVPFTIHLYSTYHLISFQLREPLCHRLHPLHQPIFFTTATIYHLSASVSQFHPTPSPTWLHLPSILFYIPIASWPLVSPLPFSPLHFWPLPFPTFSSDAEFWRETSTIPFHPRMLLDTPNFSNGFLGALSFLCCSDTQ